MTDTVFLFGTLRHEPLRDAVLGAACPVRPAALPGFQVLDHDGSPMLVAQDGAQAEGVVLCPDPVQLARLDLYESLFGYTRQQAQDADAKVVWVYRTSAPAAPDQASRWDLSDWVARLGEAATLAGTEVMALSRQYSGPDLAVRYPMLLAHACARLRAAAEPAPATLRRPSQPDDVAPVSTAHPYAYFFGVQSDDLRFRRFDGALSPVVRRAGFLMSDAVTLLPYDPARDCVLLVEQFRYGLYLRHASNCWSLEAIAGRIDGGETPQQAALREAQEEAGVSLSEANLHMIGQAYPSPGSVSEYLYQFAALCTLPEDDGAVGGLDGEAEDIRRHIIGFDHMMQLVATGEIQNGPLLTSAYWLAVNRDRLRAAYSAPDL